VSRSTELWRKAAEALEDGRDPLTMPFLADNEVSMDECFAIGDAMAAGLRLLAWAVENPEAARGAINGAHLAAAYQALNATLPKIGRAT